MFLHYVFLYFHLKDPCLYLEKQSLLRIHPFNPKIAHYPQVPNRYNNFKSKKQKFMFNSVETKWSTHIILLYLPSTLLQFSCECLASSIGSISSRTVGCVARWQGVQSMCSMSLCLLDQGHQLVSLLKCVLGCLH